MNVKLLLDENLSPAVAATLRGEGRDAVHVRERGLLGEPDHVVMKKAMDEDRILVTSNVGDFEKLAHASDLHPGLVLVEDGQLARAEQLQVLHAVVRLLEDEPDLVNRALRVWVDGHHVFEEIPPR